MEMVLEDELAKLFTLKMKIQSVGWRYTTAPVLDYIIFHMVLLYIVRGRNQRGKETTDATDGVKEAHSRPSEPTKAATRPNDASGSCKAESEAVVHSLEDRIKKLEKHMVKKVVFVSFILFE